MSFSSLMNDTIDLLKTDGTRKSGLRASVQKDKVFMDAKDILVEPQDLIIRKMSNGAEETYRVIDPGFSEGLGRIKPNYQMDVQKLGLPEAKSAVQHITFNFNGNNARVNQNSVDNSTNIVQIDARATQYIDALRREIDGSSLSNLDKAEANEVIDEIDGAFQSGKPKRPVVNALLKALPHVANVASIASALAGLLGGSA